MKTFFGLLAIFLLSQFIDLSLYGQPFSHDTTFQSSYTFRDFYSPERVGGIASVIEMDDGSIRVGGGFQDPFDNTFIGNLIKLNQVGQFDPNFGVGTSGEGIVAFLHLPYFYTMSSLGFIKRNYQTLEKDTIFSNNRDSSNWSGGSSDIFFFDNGDMLVCSGIFYHSQLPDFRFSYIARIKENGIYDTTFLHDANYNVNRFCKYDNGRIMINGVFSHYDGIPIRRVARIFNDGTLDTSFHSIFTDYYDMWIRKVIVLNDGKCLVIGRFKLPGVAEQVAIVRIMPNGDLDPTFNNFDNVQSETGLLVADSISYDNDYYVLDVLQTSDNKFLIGGNFTYYQGHYRGRIALADENGFLDTTVFTGTGIDTCLGSTVNWYTQINRIIPAQNDKYYIAGHFSRYNGKMVEPIIRLNPHNHVGVEEQEEEQGLMIYPNPVRDKINIKSFKNIEELEIYNLQGQLMQTVSNSNQQQSIDVSQFLPGTYFLRAIGKEEVWVEKFVVIRQ
ncbi:MAG: T9SS type A sorting domain-containing protein [Bacteroidales bacterium]|nr:T9SS type A sorting domain-containing protein [Bacteroidales bacterium]MCF8458248.1 T9SS type A sorting domain-containing protein [Bacteroidales bacterium]